MKSDYRNTVLTGGFWKHKEDLNRDITLNAVYEQFDKTGRVAAFRCDWKEGMPNQPHVFWDSDVAKWMEGASYALYRQYDADLESKIEALIDCIEKNQAEDGYFNIYYLVVMPGKRYTNRDMHELYCAGHLIEAAVAYYEATGRDRFLRLMEKYAAYIKAVFMDKTAEPMPKFQTPGHQEIEIALFRLYRCTGNKDWFDLAEFFLNQRGNNALDEGHSQQIQSHLPVRKQKTAVGHSVRAGYQYAAMTTLARETGEKELADTCRTLFDDITKYKMYITGGVGSRSSGEAYSIPYDFLNDKAYAETCAAVSMIFFAHEMFLMDRESRFADVIERELYNGVLSGLSLSGDEFFYENPLEIHPDNYRKTWDRYPISERVKVFSCSCCPPNLNRVLASLSRYFYASEEGSVWVNQFGESEYACDGMTVVQKTEYPYDGRIALQTKGTKEVYVRIPGWCRSFSASRTYTMVNGYACFAGEGEIVIDLVMEPVFLQSNILVYKNLDTAAVQYGPVVYCAEGLDNNGDVHSLYLNVSDPDWEILPTEEYGCHRLSVNGWRRENAEDAPFYPLQEQFSHTRIRLIPYHAFANRGTTPMLVYLHYRQ
ncbi:MAG: glycoside hydrolase family 127 protein [Clostridia bacterium]|nr:glycoside hydrolase family 127 protein [Clostridia bacterium]